MIRPLAMWTHPTLQHLPAQVEWINRNERVTLSLTFDWRQLFSMFIARDDATYNQYFSRKQFVFGPPCRWRVADGTARKCMEHGGEGIFALFPSSIGDLVADLICDGIKMSFRGMTFADPGARSTGYGSRVRLVSILWMRTPTRGTSGEDFPSIF